MFLIGRLHSEFSSILYRKHRFPQDQWQRINVAGFSYPRSSLEFLDQGGLYGQDNGLLNQGFVVKYAQSSLENDFNMITDWLFTRPTQLRSLGIQDARMSRQLAGRGIASLGARCRQQEPRFRVGRLPPQHRLQCLFGPVEVEDARLRHLA